MEPPVERTLTAAGDPDPLGALLKWFEWLEDPKRGGGCWCKSGHCGYLLCPNMPADVKAEGDCWMSDAFAAQPSVG